MALTSIIEGVGSLKGPPSEYNGKQLTIPDPDRVFNAILGRRAQGTSRSDRTAIYSNLTPDRFKPQEAAEIRLRRYRGDYGNLDP
ncbi:hypothetical protein PanWU01x14_193050 [Parasponia andersonii]|uniref:Uncharacterized protein n=1 Tax=Parasponia andersonii TaxID=3476 RepID=A0A2P5C1A8_PARAD|nr:hypothetical protein PanWU01x14_193050 [Parasponia andersonii]